MKFGCNKFQTLIGNIRNQVTTILYYIILYYILYYIIVMGPVLTPFIVAITPRLDKCEGAINQFYPENKLNEQTSNTIWNLTLVIISPILAKLNPIHPKQPCFFSCNFLWWYRAVFFYSKEFGVNVNDKIVFYYYFIIFGRELNWSKFPVNKQNFLPVEYIQNPLGKITACMYDGLRI